MQITENKRTYQKAIAKYKLAADYLVRTKTFEKWLIIFCIDMFPDEAYIRRRRRFSAKEVEVFKERLGATSQPFNKSDFKRMAETTYRTIRENIQKYPLVYILPIETYNHISKFPPKVAERILNGLG
jgi:hypothetical protein